MLLVVFFSRFLIFLIAFTSDFILPDRFPQSLSGVSEILTNELFPHIPGQIFAKWDSFYYVHIAAQGYLVKREFWAFRPFYPLILRVFLYSFGYANIALASLAWNMFAFSLASIYLYKLGKMFMDQRIAFLTILFLSVCPASIFFTAIYPETTYLLLTVSSFYYLEKNRIGLATFLATLAGFTRPEGFLLCIPFFWKALTLRGLERIKSTVGSVVTGSTLPVFMLYGYALTGNAFIPFEVEAGWTKVTLLDLFKIAFTRGELHLLTTYSPISTIVLIITIFSIVMYFFHIHVRNGELIIKLNLDREDRLIPYYIWTILSLSIFIYIGGFASFSRFVSTLFPILWFNTFWARNEQVKFYVLLSLYVGLMSIGTSFFINWYSFI